jgi:hypothetical protein|tara:strand:- start:17 stop:484 length:468 start_codon:yes stop_codon:yes gene_type:complete
MALALVEDNAVTKYPVGLGDLRTKFPNISFPKSLEGEDLTSLGVVSVSAVEKPAFNSSTQQVEEGTPALIDGTWQQTWNVIDFTEHELRTNDENSAVSVREERNLKLAACDWTVLTDSPLTTAKKTEWKTYRTALRNITAAEGFPHTMEWPTEPS